MAVTEEDLNRLRESFEERMEQRIRAEAGKPLVPGQIQQDWNDRGNFTRPYAHSVVTFAIRAFYLDEQVTEANQALTELCQYYLDHPGDMYEAHSFHWSGAIYCRLWKFFSEGGSIGPGRMTGETREKMLEMMWAWLRKASNALSPKIDEARTWRMANSENHHAMGTVTCWGFAQALAQCDTYRSRECEGGGTPADHVAAWTAYFKEYFRQRAMKGLNVEIASKSYNSHTLQMWYNLFDFAEDATLKKRAGYYLDVYWTAWAEEQIDGVRGGGKTRIYQGPGSRSSAGDAVGKLAGHYLGGDGEGALGSTEWVVVTSDYRMPSEAMRVALDVESRGEYEVRQRCAGLAEPGWQKGPGSGVTFFGVTGYRRDFGGFLRYSYCTPDFVMGTLMLEAHPLTAWTGAAIQNRWQGVIFRGHPDALIFPECMPTRTNRLGTLVTMNQHWSVQKKGSLVMQKLGPGLGGEMGDMRVWFAEPGLSDPLEEDGWAFVEAEGAYAAVRPVASGFSWDEAGEGEHGRWLHCGDDLAPIILEVGRRRDHADYAAFRQAVKDGLRSFENSVLTYRGLSGDTLTLYADYAKPPEINGEAVNFTPPKVFDSPHIQSDWDSGVVTLSVGGEKRVLDFNVE